MLDWISLLQVLFWLSVAISVVGTFVMPLLIVRIPADYFSRPSTQPRSSGARNRGWQIVRSAVRNSLALVFFVAGVIMLFTPGQGLLMLVVSLWLASFPGKRDLERRLLSTPGVATVVNKIRQKAGVAPLELSLKDNSRVG